MKVLFGVPKTLAAASACLSMQSGCCSKSAMLFGVYAVVIGSAWLKTHGTCSWNPSIRHASLQYARCQEPFPCPSWSADVLPSSSAPCCSRCWAGPGQATSEGRDRLVAHVVETATWTLKIPLKKAVAPKIPVVGSLLCLG